MVSIVLPTYNERKNVEILINDITNFLKSDFEIIVVDDDSPDGTHAVVERIRAGDSRIRCIRRRRDRGLTKSIQEGIDASRGDLIGWMDADLSMPAVYLKTMVELVMQDNYDVAIASRFVPNGGNVGDSRIAEWASLLLSLVGRYAVGMKVRDITSGYLVAKRHVLDNIRLCGDYGEYFIYLVYELEQRNYRVAEVPYTPLPRIFGESKTNPSLSTFLFRGAKYLKTVAKVSILKVCE